MHPELQLIQDNTSRYIAGSIIKELAERGIIAIFWPAFSPDFNPIKTIWNWMKDYIKRVYGDAKLSYDQLRKAIREAWDSITVEQLQELINSTQQRCQDVINAQGGYRWWKSIILIGFRRTTPDGPTKMKTLAGYHSSQL